LTLLLVIGERYMLYVSLFCFFSDVRPLVKQFLMYVCFFQTFSKALTFETFLFFRDYHTEFFDIFFSRPGITEFGGLAWSDTLWCNHALASLILSENPLGDEVCV
jgi:hypothetical protein